MLEEMLNSLTNRYKINAATKKDKHGRFEVKIGIHKIEVTDLDPGVRFWTRITKIPAKKREELFIFLMRANFLGQGTGGAVIGMDHPEKYLTLSLDLPYEVNYEIFREQLEDFINFVDYWAEEVEEFERKG